MCGTSNQTKVFAALSVLICMALFSGCAVSETYVSSGSRKGGSIVIRVASSQNTDPFQAGKQAAVALRERMGQVTPHTIVLTEYFEDKAKKKEVLKGVTSIFEAEIVFGFATYGSFNQQGCLNGDSVGIMGIGGEGIATVAALRRDLGIAGLTMEKHRDELSQRLRTGGADLATKLSRGPSDRLMVVMADAHSPKNQFLLEGIQEVMGEDFPITGGSANKNAGQTFVYFQGRMYTDSAIALLLSGDFEVSLSGRQISRMNSRLYSL
ncbi:MAG: FIST N-terminal domain-containing protein [Planctomycetota bacterium]|jgi:hypothetical protein